jgi:hypothetical protein
MDIHKPKGPIHSWREFVGEVGIIVLGVLIALGAEQAVEALHWRERVEAEREALHAEARENLGAVALRLSQNACVTNRLNALQVVFKQHARHEPLNIRGAVGRPLHYTGSTNVWKMAAADQAISHMPLREQIAISQAYDNYEGFNNMLDTETAAWSRLSILNAPETLEASDWAALHQAYADALSANDRLQNNMTAILAIEALGQKPDQLRLPAGLTAQREVFCSPLI